MFKVKIRQIFFLVLIIVIVLLSFKNIYALPNYYVEKEVPGVTKKNNLQKAYDFNNQNIDMENIMELKADDWFRVAAYRRVYLLDKDEQSNAAKIRLPEDDNGLWVPLNVVKKGRHHRSFTNKQIKMIENMEIKIGASEKFIKAVLGKPDKVNKTVTAGKVSKQYVYRSHPYIDYVYFENGKVTSWQE